MSTKPGPTFGKRKPRLNHVAMSLSPDVLDEEHRKLLVDFYSDVFGFVELPMLTEDRRRLVLQVHDIEQFLFLIAEDEPMTAPRLDHFGVSVASVADFEEVHRRAAAWAEKEPEHVDLIAPQVEEYVGALKLHSFYVRYRLPLMLETQHFEYLF